MVAASTRSIFSTHGPPLVLKSDNGSPFVAEPFEELLKQWQALASRHLHSCHPLEPLGTMGPLRRATVSYWGLPASSNLAAESGPSWRAPRPAEHLKRSAIFGSRGGELLRHLIRPCVPAFPRGCK